MNTEEFENISQLLKAHYGATSVSLDKDILTVYGSDVDAVRVAITVEFDHLYDVIYDYRDEANKHVVMKLAQKGVDKNNKVQ